MFIYRTQIRLKDTDATGVLYFSEQYKFALEAFEEFLKGPRVFLKSSARLSILIPRGSLRGGI